LTTFLWLQTMGGIHKIYYIIFNISNFHDRRLRKRHYQSCDKTS
jgi:hypothetical protein